MKIRIGDIFESNAKTLVNTVNCVGVMGKGIALEFKKKYPNMYSEYVELCDKGAVKPGIPYYYHDLFGNSVLNFPTKDHWRSPSKLSYIISGLDWFRCNYESIGITSIAFPPLGCGNGGLSWTQVGPLMYSKLADLPIDIEIYAPYGTPPDQITSAYLQSNSFDSVREVIGNQRQKINKYWLLILQVISKLNNDRYSLSVGRTIFQKICYLLTYKGVPTGFHFSEGAYGPYSKDAKEALAVLSNANYMSERQLGQMIETVVSPKFILDYSKYSTSNIEAANQTYDLLSRIQRTDQAELIATVLFSYDELSRQKTPITETEVFNHVLKWKRRWMGEKEAAIVATIRSLSEMGWMHPDASHDTLSTSDDWMY